MTITRKIIIINWLVLIVILFFSTKIFAVDLYVKSEIKLATGVIDPDDFEPSKPNQSDIDPIMTKANVLIGIIRTIGVVVTFVTLMVLGIKYMTGSVSEKAEYKKTMLPYLIGAFVFLALTQMIAVITKVVSEVNV